MTEDRELAARMREAMATQTRGLVASSELTDRIVNSAVHNDFPGVRDEPERTGWHGWLLPAVAAVLMGVLVSAALVGGSLLHSRHQQPSSQLPPLPQYSSSVVPAPTTASPPTSRPSATPSESSSPAPTGSTSTAPQTSGPSVTVPVGGPVPAGFRAVDLTWVSSQDGWALGTAPCAAAPCTSIVRTSDGGKSWVGIPAPKARLSQTDSCSSSCDQVSHLRFANARVGYAFGLNAFFLTTDGGQHWIKQSGGYAYSLEIVDGAALRVVGQGPACAPGCTFKIQRAAIGATNWQDVALPSGGQTAGAELGASGRTAVLATFSHVAGGAQNATSVLFSSTDGGRTWRKLGEPCPRVSGAVATGEVDTVAVTVAEDGSITGLCSPRGGGSPLFTVTSTDGGAHFSAPSAGVGTGLGNVVAAASGSTLLANTDQLYRSTDGGKHWQPTGKQAPPSAAYIGFESPTLGRVLGTDAGVTAGSSSVWTTTDAGASWTRSNFR